MARVTHVKKAQQRYGTKPVLDEDGKPKRTQVMKNGEPKMTRAKRGRPARPVYMTITERDLNDPKPLETCDSCHQPIEIGTPYKWIQPKTSANGGRKRSRHESCPNWKVWEYSNSWSARIAQAVDGFSIETAESVDDVQAALDDVAAAIEELAEESATSATSMEDGFGHSTSQSEEAAERAESLETWADEIKQADIPDLPEPEEEECEYCGGTGKLAETVEGDEDTDPDEECTQCDGEGTITPEEPSEEQMNDWRDEVRDACSIVEESPV
jgi:hypothetical protein